MNKKLITKLQYFIFLALGVFLSWWSLKDLDQEKRNQIKTALDHAKYWLIIPVFVVFILSHWVRALRWKLIIKSLGYHTRTDNAFYAVMIGYLTNMAIPRLGEILKCSLLAKYQRLPADKLFGTIILERIVDAFSLIFILAITLGIQPHLYTNLINTFFYSSSTSERNTVSGFLVACVLVGIMAVGIAFWMLIKKKNITDVLKFAKHTCQRILQGVIAIRHVKEKNLFLIYTVSLWFLYFLGGYILLYAFRETAGYGVREALAILTAGSVGMILTPGGIGAFAFLIKKTMELYGLQEGVALAFGWILWLVDVFVVVSGGVFSFVAFPYFNNGKQMGDAVQSSYE